jgi:phosphate transport system substrate-binding protein
MTMKKISYLMVLSFLAACSPKSGDQASSLSGSVLIDGSSTVYPVTEAVAEEFNLLNPRVRVTVGVSGTGGGFKKLLRKEIDVANASRPISKDEIAQFEDAKVEFIELPVAYDGLAVVVNPKNTFVDYLTVEELKKIWSPEAQGKITKWSHIRSGWPAEEIHLFGAGTASGTFDYFTEAVVGTPKASRGDYTASEDDNVLVQGVATDPLALGFFGLEYYLQNKSKLKLIPIDDNDDENGEGAIIPTEETVKNGTYQPLSRPLFVYVLKESVSKPSVKSFVQFYIDNAADLVQDVGYVSLGDSTYSLLSAYFNKGRSGSAFASLESNVGIKMEEILK